MVAAKADPSLLVSKLNFYKLYNGQAKSVYLGRHSLSLSVYLWVMIKARQNLCYSSPINIFSIFLTRKTTFSTSFSLPPPFSVCARIGTKPNTKLRMSNRSVKSASVKNFCLEKSMFSSLETLLLRLPHLTGKV